MSDKPIAIPIYDLAEQISEKANKAYCDYVTQMERELCLGYERKLKDGTFSDTELEAHVLAGELLGKHRAFGEVREEIRASLADLVRQVEAKRDEAKRNAARPHKIGAYYPDEWSGQVKAYNRMLTLLGGPR